MFAPAQGGKVRIVNVATVLGRNIFFAYFVLEIYLHVGKLTLQLTPLSNPCHGMCALACIGNRITYI